MSYESGQPQVYLLQIETGQRELVGNFPGMTFAPRFSPDGQKVIMSLLRDDGNSNIFAMDLRSRTTTRLTNSSSIDTSPSYSPDGSQVVFTSDRGGRAADLRRWARTAPARPASPSATAAIRRRCGRRAATSSPSPSRSGGEFQIGVMKTDGSGERILSTGFQQEGPTWAPNGRVLMFFREAAGSGGPQLYLDRPDRPQRTGDPDRQLRFGPGLVAAARIAIKLAKSGRSGRFSMAGPRFRRISAKGARALWNMGWPRSRMRGSNETLTVFLERRLTATWLLDDQRNHSNAKERRACAASQH